MGKNISDATIGELLVKACRQVAYFFYGFLLMIQIKTLGSGSKVLSGVIVSGGKNIKIGKKCFIGRNVLIDARQGSVEIGNNVEIRDNVRIYSTGIVIGNGVTIGENSFLNGKITIKDKAWIARGCDLAGDVYIEQAILGPKVCVVTGTGHKRDPKTGALLMSSKGIPQIQEEMSIQQVRILAGSWLGNSAIVLKGITISKNMVVGAGSIVTKNFESNSVIAGVPAKEINSKTYQV